MKKTFSIIAVLMAVLLFLTSCAKSVSKDEAVNFAKENYDYSSVKYTSCTESTTEVVSKSEGVFKTIFKEGTKENSTEVKPSLKTFDVFVSTANDLATYSIDGKKIIVTIEFTSEQFLEESGLSSSMPEGASITGKGMKAVYTFNENGYLVEVQSSVEISIEATAVGITVSGAVNYSTVVEYEYK